MSLSSSGFKVAYGRGANESAPLLTARCSKLMAHVSKLFASEMISRWPLAIATCRGVWSEAFMRASRRRARPEAA